MIYTRRPERKYLLGFDLQDKFFQISYLNTRRLSVEAEPRTFSYVAGREAFNIPAVVYYDQTVNDPENPGAVSEEHPVTVSAADSWLYGNDAVRAAAAVGETPVSHILQAAVSEEPMLSCGGKTESARKLLAGLIGYCLSLLAVEVAGEEIEAAAFTAADMDRQTAQVLTEAAVAAGLPEDKLFFEQHLRSFYSYVMMQDEEQRRQSILLTDGWEDGEVQLSRLSFNRKTKPIVCFPQTRTVRISAEMEGQEKDALLSEALASVFNEQEVSAAYLTGDLFDGSWMKNSLDLLCRGRRAFQGDNLYSKGAVFGLLLGAGLGNRADRYFFLGEDALRCNIGIRCVQKRRNVYRALLDAGTSWYDASATLDFFLGGEMRAEDTEIVLEQSPVDGEEPREIALSLKNLPDRAANTMRFRMHLSVRERDKLQISVEDLGFGEIFPSSGMRWEWEIRL